jgi:uncharacterized protein
MRILARFGMTQAIARHIEPILLARRGASLAGLIEPARCERLSGLAAPVRVELRFASDGQGRPLVTGRLAARVVVRCERCLRPLGLDLEPVVGWRLVRPAEGAAAEPGVEDIDFDGGEVDLLALIEDELLLALPSFPRHAHACREDLPEVGEWVGDTAREPAPAPAPGSKRPFAGLAGLLGRRGVTGPDDEAAGAAPGHANGEESPGS